MNDKIFIRKIAAMYDRKISKGLNEKLAENDAISFNHSGILLANESIEKYKRKAYDEASLLKQIHLLEKNVVIFAMKFFKKDSNINKKTMLDAGCGGGGSAIMLHKELGCKVEGYTLSKGQANFGNMSAKKYKLETSVRFFQGNMLNLNADNCKFDLLWVCESTEHILHKDVDKMFKEFRRVAKPNARLVLTAWTSQVGLHKNAKKIKRLIDNHYLTDIHTAKEYISAAKNNDWKLIKKIDLSHKSRPYWELRTLSKNATGSETYFIEGYKKSALKYYVYVFDLEKIIK